MKKLTLADVNRMIAVLNGGEGSGNFGHAGRPGKVGGSQGGLGKTSVKGKLPDLEIKSTNTGIVAKSSVGSVGGHIHNGKRFVIGSSEVLEKERGKGYGISLYIAAIEEAKKRGLEITSDSTVEEPAYFIYKALQRRGYDFIENPNAIRHEDDFYYVKGSNVEAPVFILKYKGQID